jgi:hypothetical protein
MRRFGFSKDKITHQYEPRKEPREVVAEPDRLLMSVEDYLTLDRTSVEARYEFIDG